MALDPLGEEVPDDRLRGRPDHVRLFEFLAAGDRDYRQFRRKALDVLGFLGQEALRDQQREVRVAVPGRLEASVQVPLHHFPDRVAVGLDDHAAFDDLGRFGHVGLLHDVLIPGGEVLIAGGNG